MFLRGHLVAALAVCASAAAAPITLQQAVERAVAQYPAAEAARERVAAAAAGINLARTAYLPRVEAMAQLNRATRNNTFGLVLPQTVLPSISGPVLGTNSMTNVWGSAAGFSIAWEPFDFGYRRANVAIAEASRTRAELAAERTRFEVGATTADAFLTLLAAERTVKAAAAGVERAAAIERSAKALVDAELRPGADLSRAQAESAMARNQVIQAEQAVDVARAALAQLLGARPADVAIDAGPFLGAPPSSASSPGDAAAHPEAREQNSAVEEVKAREKAMGREYFPRFNVQGASYARGSGANADGTTGGAASGLGPNLYNWAVGFTVTFSPTSIYALRARKDAELHRERAEAARYRQLLQDLNGRIDKARAIEGGARRLAANTPVALDAARMAERQATARYAAGLGTLVEVADAQRLLTQTEIDDALARLNVWRATLGVAFAEGDLAKFVAASAGK